MACTGTFTLTGQAFKKTQCSTLTFLWTQLSGPDATIISPTSLITDVSYSDIGTYVFQLMATDGVNSGSAQTTVDVVSGE